GGDGDRAPVVGGNVTDDRQAQPGAAGLPAAGPVDAVEALEDPFEVTGGDADALVGHAHHDPLALDGGLQFDHRSRLRVLDGVVEQVDDGRDHLALVAEDEGRIRGCGDQDLDVTLGGEGTDPLV